MKSSINITNILNVENEAKSSIELTNYTVELNQNENQNLVLNKIVNSQLINNKEEEVVTVNLTTVYQNKLSCVKKIYEKLFIKSCFPINNSPANKIVLFFLISISCWFIVFLLVNEKALPGGIYFSLAVLLITAHAFGFLFEKIKMPSLLGMLLVGIFFKNVPVLSIVGRSIDSPTSSILRNISFCVILCRAGLSLDLNTLFKLKWKIIRFSFLPCLTETVIFGIVGKFILNIPFTWAFLLGFVICGVSPAVVVPLMIELEDKHLGIAKKIPSLIIAASCVDNIVAIAGHSLMIGIIFSKGEIWWTVLLCFIQVLIGLVYGLVVGLLTNVVRVNHTIELVSLRFATLLIFSLIALLGSKKISYTTSGPLGVLTLAIVAKQIWQKVDYELLKKENDNNTINKKIVITLLKYP